MAVKHLTIGKYCYIIQLQNKIIEEKNNGISQISRTISKELC